MCATAERSSVCDASGMPCPSKVVSFSLRSHSNGSRWSDFYETRPAQYTFALPRLEWDSCVAAASRADDVRFDSKPTCRAFRLALALFAMFRFVVESLLMKEFLLSRRKHKHHTAIYAQDISVSKRNNSPPPSRFREGSTGDSSPSVK